MVVTWHGLGCLEIVAKGANGETRVVVDPFDATVGRKFPKNLSANFVVSTEDAVFSNAISSIDGTHFDVTIPGEYEVGGIFVTAFPFARKDGTAHMVARVGVEGMEILHLGALDRPLDAKELETLGNIDILVLPVGGGPVLGTDDAVSMVQSIEPRAVLPVWYGDCGEVSVKENDANAFLKELGKTRVEAMSKWKVSKTQLPEEDLEVVVLYSE